MKLTKSQIKQIIKEELEAVIREQEDEKINPFEGDVEKAYHSYGTISDTELYAHKYYNELKEEHPDWTHKKLKKEAWEMGSKQEKRAGEYRRKREREDAEKKKAAAQEERQAREEGYKSVDHKKKVEAEREKVAAIGLSGVEEDKKV
tara:strand:+ start:230 stop:670 length:441 start_codon:yes stop_codon:yes gene_type:complete